MTIQFALRKFRQRRDKDMWDRWLGYDEDTREDYRKLADSLVILGVFDGFTGHGTPCKFITGYVTTDTHYVPVYRMLAPEHYDCPEKSTYMICHDTRYMAIPR